MATPDRPSPWRRFLAQETSWQKFLVALAAMVTALATVVGGTYGLVTLVADDGVSDSSASGSGSSKASKTPSFSAGEGDVIQGSPEADNLVRVLLAHADDRVDLDVDVLGQEGSEASAYDVHLWYNCAGQAPGPDHCSDAKLWWNDSDRGGAIIPNPTRFRFNGEYAVELTEGAGYGSTLSLHVEKIVT